MLDDSQIRENILLDNESLVIMASAGSGKTTIMTNKIRKDLEGNKSHYTVAAVTFMRKAAKDIRSKLGKGYSNVFVGTNDSFVEQEIILPFINDLYPEVGNYTIKYDRKFNNYSQGIQLLKTENIIGVYRDGGKRNFKFDLALDILKNSEAASQYLKAKYFKLFIDEYQDSDQSMHDFFMWLIDELKIKLFIVGDEKQSIYKWRGAFPLNFVNLTSNTKFKTYQLTRNFRSEIDIQNFANSLYETTSRNIVEQKDVKNVVLVNPNNENLTKVEIVVRLIETLELDINKEITVIINVNTEITDFISEINELGYNFSFIPKTPIDGAFKNTNFLQELATYYFDINQNEYDLIEEIVGDYTLDQINKLKDILKDFKYSIKTTKILEDTIIDLYNFFEIAINIEEVTALVLTLEDESNSIAFNSEKIKHKALTVFTSKGLEFDQVVSFSNYYFGTNNFGYKVNKFEDHYVCITRAKEKFIMIYENFQYGLNINEIIKNNTGLSMNNFMKIYKS
ncbi:DNA helicase II [Peribacillus frigoritolerans]|uniref:UvrD-helicase domain-containing protein n=1 Tax=Peribacillus frigoritolerans TaxID=450367 RepID=UPI001DC03665|nr:UvrD-helicase domain-containing protein [Peribacillus frigoritolerans]CAH0311768.1 DNA helicase II [Peribacillus frigoritolerans]